MIPRFCEKKTDIIVGLPPFSSNLFALHGRYPRRLYQIFSPLEVVRVLELFQHNATLRPSVDLNQARGFAVFDCINITCFARLLPHLVLVGCEFISLSDCYIIELRFLLALLSVHSHALSSDFPSSWSSGFCSYYSNLQLLIPFH